MAWLTTFANKCTKLLTFKAWVCLLFTEATYFVLVLQNQQYPGLLRQVQSHQVYNAILILVFYTSGNEEIFFGNSVESDVVNTSNIDYENKFRTS